MTGRKERMKAQTLVIDGRREKVEPKQLVSVEVVGQAPAGVVAILIISVRQLRGRFNLGRLTFNVVWSPSDDFAKSCHLET